MAENKCKGKRCGHLCVLVSNGEFDKIKDLVKNPKYLCFNCGRVSSSEKNLCNPMPLKD